jgi:hypothetical protein
VNTQGMPTGVEALSEDMRAVLELSEAGQSEVAVAQALGIPVGTVKSRRARLRAWGLLERPKMREGGRGAGGVPAVTVGQVVPVGGGRGAGGGAGGAGVAARAGADGTAGGCGAVTMADLVVAGIDPGVRYVGVGVVASGRLVRSERWTLPAELTQACMYLRGALGVLIVLENVQVLAFEAFSFHREKGAVSTAAAMYNLLGVMRSLHGWQGVAVREVPAGVWGQRFTGLRVPRQGVGRRDDEWKRQVVWYVEREAGPGCAGGTAGPGTRGEGDGDAHDSCHG